MRKPDRVTLFLVAFFAIFALLFIALVLLHKPERDYYRRYAPPLEQELGFNHGSPYPKQGDKREEVITLHPEPGGLMARAGVQSGDILITDAPEPDDNFFERRDKRSVNAFYRKLEAGRGGWVTFRVVPGGDGPPLAQRSVRVIRLKVPRSSQGMSNKVKT